jgi:DNA-binding GntR family transcriptional regulator
MLMTGRLAPGDKLSLRAVAAALGVSMMPVREAALRLGAEAALEIAPKRAVTVPTMRMPQFRDLTRLRVEVEGFAAALAATHADAPATTRLRRAEKAFAALGRKRNPDLGQAVAANQAFHFALYRAAESPELLGVIERLWLRVGPIINLDLRENPERLKFGEAARFHAEACAAIENGDADAARAAIVSDIRGAADFILSRGRLPA